MSQPDMETTVVGSGSSQMEEFNVFRHGTRLPKSKACRALVREEKVAVMVVSSGYIAGAAVSLLIVLCETL
jgi:hypothetical protein